MDQNEKKDRAGGDQASRKLLTEEERTRMRRRTNRRIAHWCSFFALIVVLIDFAAYVIGQADEFFTTAGIMLSIALLAIAMLYNPTDSTKHG